MHSHAILAVGILAVLFALLVPLQKTLYASALCLLGSLLSVAALYFLFGSPLLAWMQVLIYAGAVMVLVVLSIMTSAPSPGRLWARWDLPRPLVAAVLLLPLGALALAVGLGASPAASAAARGLEREMAAVLFGSRAAMTEALGVLILLASLAVFATGRERA